MNRHLPEELERLFTMVSGGPGQPPRPSTVLIAKLRTGVRHGPRLQILRSDLRTPEAFAAEFDSLLEAGFSWINLSYCGLLGKAAVVTLEHSRDASRGRDTPVNFSGPPRRVAEAGWNVLADIELVDAIPRTTTDHQGDHRPPIATSPSPRRGTPPNAGVGFEGRARPGET